MKKLGLFGAILAISSLTGCGTNNKYVPPTTPYEKVKTAFSGVESSFRNVSSNNAKQLNKKLSRVAASSTLDSLFSIFSSEDNQGDVIEDLSYTQPPMIQFQCLKYAFDKIGSNYSFDTKYYDTVIGKVYIDFETGLEGEHKSQFEYDYSFTLGLAINIDANDFITADVSFSIVLSKEGNTYQTDWYVSMALNYNMDKENPTYTLTMLTNNDETGIPYYDRCVYEYDYVDVQENQIKEWRKFDLEAHIPLVKDNEHQTFASYINDGVSYEVGSFSWYKNSAFYKAKDLNRNTDRRERVANLLYELGLNATDIDKAPFFNKQGNKNNVIQTMYSEFSNIFRKDIIYSLVTRDDVEPAVDQLPKYLKLVDSRTGEEMREENEFLLGDKNALFSDLFIKQDVYSSQGYIPVLKIFNKNYEYIRDAQNDDIEIKVVVNGDNLLVDMVEKVVDVSKRYDLPIMTLEVSLKYEGEILDSKKVTINLAPFMDAIIGWPYDVLSSMGIDKIIPPFTSKSYKAHVESVSTLHNPSGCHIDLSGVEYEEVQGYQKNLKEMMYGEVYKNPTYAIPDRLSGKVFLLWFDGYTLKIEETNEFKCAYSEQDKATFSALNQDVLLPEGLVFNHPSNIAETFDYYGVSSDTFNAFIQRLIGNGWKENEDPYSWYKYYFDNDRVRYCINSENIGDYAKRISYYTQDAPSDVLDGAELIFSDDFSINMENDEEGNLYVEHYFVTNQEFYILGHRRGEEVILNYNDLELNDVANNYLSEGKKNNIRIKNDVLLKIKIINSDSGNKIVCSLIGGQIVPEHTYTLVGQFNSWSVYNGIDFTYDSDGNYFFIKNYHFITGDGFAILEDGGWSVYYGYSDLDNPYSDLVFEGETNGVVPKVSFSATIIINTLGVISFTNVSIDE